MSRIDLSRVRLWIFDLDGTLIDSRLDLVDAVNVTLHSLGHSALDEDLVVSFVGDGADDLLRKSLRAAGHPRGEIDRILPETLRGFLDYYGAHCVDRTVPYPGIMNLLGRIAGRSGTVMAVLTNKPEKPTLKILNHFGILHHFAHVVAGDGPHGKKPDPAGLAYILNSMNASPNDAVLVGDSLQDLQTARAVKVSFMAFLGGFGDTEALMAGNPDFTMEHPDFLLKPAETEA